MGHHKINAGKSFLRIGGVAKSHLRITFSHQNRAGFTDHALAIVMIIIETNFAQRKSVHIFQQHHNNPWSIGTAAASYRNNKFILHLPPHYSCTSK